MKSQLLPVLQNFTSWVNYPENIKGCWDFSAVSHFLLNGGSKRRRQHNCWYKVTGLEEYRVCVAWSQTSLLPGGPSVVVWGKRLVFFHDICRRYHAPNKILFSQIEEGEEDFSSLLFILREKQTKYFWEEEDDNGAWGKKATWTCRGSPTSSIGGSGRKGVSMQSWAAIQAPSS